MLSTLSIHVYILFFKSESNKINCIMKSITFNNYIDCIITTFESRLFWRYQEIRTFNDICQFKYFKHPNNKWILKYIQ